MNETGEGGLDTTAQSPVSGDAPTHFPTVKPSQVATVNLARTTVLPQVEVGGAAGLSLQPVDKPRYREVSTLGQGGVGEVALAEDQDIGRKVAVKRLRDQVVDPGSMARFVEEV